jgi:hypothetical protein
MEKQRAVAVGVATFLKLKKCLLRGDYI